MRRAALRALALALALPWLGCETRREEEEEEEAPARVRLDERGRVVLTAKERKTLGLETAVAAQGVFTSSALRFGHVVARPQEDVLVTAPITGRLTKANVDLGATVAAGRALVTLEPLVDAASRATLEAQRRELAGQIQGARAQVGAKRADLSRVTTLVTSGLATQAERAQAEATLTAEGARADSLVRASGELQRMTGGRLELRTPVPGVVATLSTEVGAVIQQGTVVARIVRAGPRWIDVAVPPGDPIGSEYLAQGIAGALKVKLLAQGTVVGTDGTRRDRLEASPDVAAALLPGATVSVEVLQSHPGLLVPSSALVRRGLETLTFVEVEDGHYEARPVKVGPRDDSRAVVASGLSAGARVVSRGAASLLAETGADPAAKRPGDDD